MLGRNTCLPINSDIENFGWKTCAVEKGSISLVMFVDEGWCGWFYTPVRIYKFHALTVYLSSSINEVTRPVLNLLLFFFMIRFHKYKKTPKSTKKH